MNTEINKKYIDVTFGTNHVKLIADTIKEDPIVLKVLVEIFMHMKTSENPKGRGITQKEIYGNEKLEIKRHACERAINILLGTTIIYGDETGGKGRDKFYRLNRRGKQIMMYITNKE